MSQETKTHITEVRTINVPVTDQERALDFYVGKLGFEKRLDVTYGPDQRWIEVAPSGATTTVALAPSGGGPTGVDTGIRFATADAEADHTHLQACGVDVDPAVTRWPGVPPMFGLRDPDGNTLRIVELTA
ncbi:MAG: VOC family protein [Thermoleophilia bacterium]|jgi:catechol 2,3-dioxygenase-like lactoylglutathione lyase family enzyme